MNTTFIYKTDEQFHQSFNEPITEIDYVLGGLVTTDGEEIIGKLVVYRNPYIRVNDTSTIAFGYLDAIHDEVANQLFSQLTIIAKEQLCKQIIGPINGSTWHNYRLMDTETPAPFLGEEVTKPLHTDYLKSNGFSVLKHYESNIVASNTFSEDFILEKENEISDKGWVIRRINTENLDNELYNLAVFSNESFKHNFLFSPIKEDDFLKKYTPFISHIDTSYIRLIENHKGELQAVLLAYENLWNNSKELIIKTVARHPNTKIKGLGSYLSHKATMLAFENNITTVIHAYIAKENDASVNISKEKLGASTYRTYSLYRKKVA